MHLKSFLFDSRRIVADCCFTVTRRLGILLSCLAMFFIAGGHLAVIQAVAWTQMVKDFSQTATVAEAVAKTFSGKNPCKLCKSVTKASAEDDKVPGIKAEKKTEVAVLVDASGDSLPAGIRFSYPRPPDEAFTVRSDAPPVPVPIFSV